ncbi:MAG: M12 family metallo-peptidase [Saprospiraceae bacterium]|nr:M12 family metallo-peptidase [Saprospiraceae bacterium]
MDKIKCCVSILTFLLWCTIGSTQIKDIPPTSGMYESIIATQSSYNSYELELIKTQFKPSEKFQEASIRYAEYVDIKELGNKSKTFIAPHIIELDIPFNGKSMHCIFERNHIKSSTYQFSSSRQEQREEQTILFYRGIVEGQTNSWATLAYIDDKFKILIAHKDGNLEVNHLLENTYAIYDSKDQKVIPEFICEYVDQKVNEEQSSYERVGSDCLELYIECDYQSFLDNGSSVASTEAWALSIINDVNTIYATINVPLVVAELFVWNSNDPYISKTNLSEVRDTFIEQLQNNYSGRIAQLFSTRPLSGGLAYGIGGLCGEYPDFPGPYSIATELSTTFDPYPNFSYTVNVVAHEMGHVLGARHTHACVWGPNNDMQIDDCGNEYANSNGDTPEGTGCYDELNPILPMNGGTVMSFCNLAGGGIDLANGFGTEVGDFIFDKYNTAICATGGECASIPPSNNDCANAIELPLNGQCTYFDYDNIMATASGIDNPSCGNVGSAQDVWFSITPSSTDAFLNFNPISGGVENVVITVYEGTCGSLTELLCEEIFDEETQVKLSALTINETLYIRIIEEDSNVEGAFQLCVIDESLPCHPAFNPLVDLYNMTNGGNWTNKSGWEDGALGADCSPCQWYGIQCDNQENIIEIDLFNNNLVGTVPANLSELTKLRILKLFANDLSGTFPDIWTNMADLEFIDLSNNLFTGTMPASLGNLMKLNTLYIENNNMTGELLPEIGDLPNLNVYWAKGNNFSGCFPGSYLQLCDIGSITFINNPLLPNTGILDLFCADGTGGDIDEDGFCFGPLATDDCVDDDNTIYPNAPELCDGKDNDCDGEYDEDVVAINTWLPIGGGDWQVASNWSLGTLPKSCEDVVIPESVTTRIISIPVSTNALGRSLTIGGNSTLINDGELNIAGSDDNGVNLNINSTLINNGMISIFNIQSIGISTGGLLENFGTINVSNLTTSYDIFIQLSGEIENKTGSHINLINQ